jgi:AcrR family transcriptional regulator
VAALGIIDASGVEACTMRAVAANLGVEAMSLYWHVPGKEALLDGVVERMLGEVAGEHVEDPIEWRPRMQAFGHAYHTVLLRHPRAIHLIAGRPFGAYVAASRMAETGLPTLIAAGFDERSAIRAIRTVTRFVLGFTLLEVSTATNPPPVPEPSSALAHIIEAVGSDDQGALFRFGLDVLLDGLEARLRRA